MKGLHLKLSILRTQLCLRGRCCAGVEEQNVFAVCDSPIFKLAFPIVYKVTSFFGMFYNPTCFHCADNLSVFSFGVALLCELG